MNFKCGDSPLAALGFSILDSPTLVVEIAASSLEDDIGRKRRLYERLGVQEYWVVNVDGVFLPSADAPEQPNSQFRGRIKS